jgi:hypothetical protein
MPNTTLMPFQPEAMSPAQLAAVSFLARYFGPTHAFPTTSCADGSTGVRPTARILWLGSRARMSSSTSVTWRVPRPGIDDPDALLVSPSQSKRSSDRWR